MSDLVPVFESHDRVALSLAQAWLQEAGIPFLLSDDETATRLVLGGLPFTTFRLLVPNDREAEARELMQPLQPPR